MHHLRRSFFILFLFYPLTTIADDETQVFSHDLFQAVISQHVIDGSVDYAAIKDDSNYQSYISLLASRSQFKNSIDELSYWINAYNALAIKGILDGRSPESFFGKIGYFYNAEYKVNGITTNLYDMEHDIIIPLGEPRIHFALNCASASCPRLNDMVYREERLEQQLEQAAIDFINNKTLNRFDIQTKTARISKIFDWFEDDFARHSGTLQNYLALYVTDQKISNALANGEFKIEYLEYDWSLNGIPPEPSPTNDY